MTKFISIAKLAKKLGIAEAKIHYHLSKFEKGVDWKYEKKVTDRIVVREDLELPRGVKDQLKENKKIDLPL